MMGHRMVDDCACWRQQRQSEEKNKEEGGSFHGNCSKFVDCCKTEMNIRNNNLEQKGKYKKIKFWVRNAQIQTRKSQKEKVEPALNPKTKT